MPKFLSPNSVSIDATLPQIFTAKIEGNICDTYQLIIYDMANVIKFDTNKITITENPLFQGDTFEYVLPVDTLLNNVQYKWILKVYSGTLLATSRETPFYAYKTPTLVMTIPELITSKKYPFQATYTQTENIVINRWYMVFLDSNDNIILQTPYSYRSDLLYEYDGFISNQSYKVYCVVENQMNVITQSPTYTFNVLYSAPSLNFIPKATLLPELSAVRVEWPEPIQIQGVVTGTSEYIPNLFTEGNTGLKLGDSSYVEFNVDIPLNFISLIDYIPDDTFTGGKMVEFIDDLGITYEIGYDSILGCFYYKHGLIIINGTPKELPNLFLIGVKSIEVVIIVNNQIYEYLKP